MRDVIREKAPRLALTFLLAAGLTFPLLGAMNLEIPVAACLLLCAGETLLLEAVCLTRRSALYGSVSLVILTALWLMAGSGGALLSDILRAVTLEISGVPGALPLMARETALLLTLLLTLLSFLCTRPGAGSLGALLLLAGSLLMLWLADRFDQTLFLLPAAIAALCLLLMERHQELKLARILPWVAALLLLVWGITPAEGLVVPALKERMDTLRQTVMDRLFFTEPRDVFSLSTEGYYPQGASQLGGPAHPTDHPVMQVSIPRGVYLRGVTMNEYDGRSWRNTLGGRRYLWDAGGMAAQRALLFDQNLPSAHLTSRLTEAAQVSVRMLGDSASTLFVPQRVRGLQTGGELVPYYTNSSELFITRNLQAGDTWSVTAPLFQAGDAGLGTLVDAAESGEDLQWDSVRETYTTLPAHLEEPVWQMAADITAGLDSAYEKAFALQNYLSRNYRYTLEPAAQPVNLDFVTHFLFNTREGYCTYFASAMTVLCRMAGLPARYVEGYLAEPDAAGEALVTGLDAHAWTEVYFRGFGWLTFDATPRRAGSRTENAQAASEYDQSAEVTPEPVPPPDAETEEPLPTEEAVTPPPEEPENPEGEEGQPVELVSPEDERHIPWALMVLILLLLAAAGAGIRWMRTSPGRRERKMTEENPRFDLWMEEVLRRLSAAGYDRRGGETMMAFTRRLDAEEGLPVRLSQLGECASLLRYGRVEALPTDTQLARDAAAGLRRGLPWKKRLRYAWRRLKPARTRQEHGIM